MNGHGETLETWQAFQAGERCGPDPKCAGCGQRNADVGEVEDVETGTLFCSIACADAWDAKGGPR